MAKLKEPIHDGPIPGMSLTTEPGNRPWEKPPQYATVEEAMKFYVQRIVDPQFRDDFLNVMEMGIPLTVIANALQSGGVMQGKHTIDVGILLLPVLIELLAFIADSDGIEYVMGTELNTDDSPLTETSIALAKKRLLDKQKAGKAAPKIEEPVAREEEMSAPTTGLMARR
jgi:hypothetical protein